MAELNGLGTVRQKVAEVKSSGLWFYRRLRGLEHVSPCVRVLAPRLQNGVNHWGPSQDCWDKYVRGT